jgi:hypothetical protein
MYSMSTTAEEYYQALGAAAGTLFYLNRKNESGEEYILEPLLVDTKNKDLTIKALQRVMDNPNFIGFPGTKEFANFVNEVVETNKK